MTLKEYKSYLKNTYSPDDAEKYMACFNGKEIEEEAEVLIGKDNLALITSKALSSYLLLNKGEHGMDSFYFQEHRKTEQHDDHQSFSLTIDGEEIILRTGISVDGKLPNKSDKEGIQPYNLLGNACYMQHTTMGYMSYENGVLAKRRIVAIGCRTLIISDEFYAVGKHEYQQTFRFNPTANVRVSGREMRYLGERVLLDVFCIGKTDVMGSAISNVRIASEDGSETEEKENAFLINVEGAAFKGIVTVIHARIKGDDGSESETVSIRKLIPESVFQGISLPDSEAEALELLLGNQSYIVVIGRNDAYGKKDIIRAADCTAFGNVMVFDTSLPENPVTILK